MGCARLASGNGAMTYGAMQRRWILSGSLAGLSAVAMAALASHALPGRVDAHGLLLCQSAIQMQGWHALALVFCGCWAERGGRPARLAGAAFLLGMLLFCGTLYALALTGSPAGAAPWFEPAAPAGGMLLMLGWLLLAVSALRAPPAHAPSAAPEAAQTAVGVR